MLFDVVIGNPPYNRGMDIDFVNLGYDLSGKFTCMITPAKWQTADGNLRIASKVGYAEFRDKIVPHMSHVVFYPCCKDIFDIYQCDGISYYLIDIDKDEHDKCIVVNRSTYRNIINKYNTTFRSILNRETLWNCGYELADKLKEYKRLYIGDTGKRYKVMTNKQISGYDWFTKEGPRYCLAVSVVLDSYSNDSVEGVKGVSFSSDSLQECYSFISYINTRFVRFLLAINISSEHGMVTSNNFRFVPIPMVVGPSGNTVPGKFDHIYTDEELYKAFNIQNDQIEVIESIIRERK